MRQIKSTAKSNFDPYKICSRAGLPILFFHTTSSFRNIDRVHNQTNVIYAFSFSTSPWQYV